ncbi:hypothetical protein ASPBRDRAFT_666024 [Aspergillus brasiliensis CBS 101740]|uniref:LysM domain-containing protein n=1 Tax=Aspergillus brasiliensis (strain CBS 101740 / IMI 381727 / IBT 21946) TaxID=767769 RepID=A0A1L9U417_ASPBC|nr:hypothetical protein ASPBRDRAFT_666024 [Aspergillus brasiliensis CBS 101740]
MATFQPRTFCVLLWMLPLRLSWGQQLSGAASFMDYPGLSTACRGALETNVTCPPFLRPISASGKVLDTDQITELCVDSCYSSLEAARNTIKGACTAATDIIVYDNIAYPVQSTDDCNSVALSLNVSTYNLLYANGIDLYCQNFAAAVNSTLCIPPQCDTYIWQASDTCDSVAGSITGVTVPQFLSWNPNFNSLCQNSPNYVGYVVCVSPPGGYLNFTASPTNGSTGYTGGATTAVPAPTNAMTGTNKDCSQWYTVLEGDNCALVSVRFSLALSDFYFLNPEIDANCTNLELGEAYCVAPVGTLTTYSGYPVTTPFIVITSATFPSVNTAIPTASSHPGYVATSSLLPTASGTVADCTTYRNYDDTNGLNDCSYIAAAEGVTTDELLAWNPSLPATNCVFQSGNSYCVYRTNATPDTDDTSYCLPTNATEPGTISTCNCFTEVIGYQNSSGYSCDDIETGFSLTATPLLAWNTWMGSDCNSALFKGLGYYDIRAICVGVGSTSTGSPTTTSSVAAPTQTGITADCQEFYTVESGDTCTSIEAQFGITFGEFYSWNPSIGSGCTNLWLGYAYCVKSTQSTATATGPDGPVQTGIASNCDAYYTVASGDSCAAIESRYDLTFAQLYQWNPAIGSDCTNLWVGYAVCVGVSS